MTLTQIASAAVRRVNKENDIKLSKVAEFGNADLGAVVYKDKEWCEYRVMHFAEGEHLAKADYHTRSVLPEDLEDAKAVAQQYVKDHAATAQIKEIAPASPTPAQEVIPKPTPVIKSRNQREGKYMNRTPAAKWVR